MTSLRESERQALVKLLGDDDPTVLQLLEERFAEMGAAGRTFLESVAVEAEPAVRGSAQRILESLKVREVDEDFARFCATCDTPQDLETGCWLLARTRYLNLEPAPYKARLDRMAQELRARLTGRETPTAAIEVANRYMFRKLGFRGNEEDYYDPDNSYLNRVLDRRLGIPITLSIVYLLLGRRLAWPLEPVNLPGHFILRWRSRLAQFYVDPFYEGRMLDEADCRALCAQRELAFNPGMLAPTGTRLVLLRMLNNLRAIYSESDPSRAERLERFIALLAER
jgi:regulator of sirC expression with transglutaminase-like and TPR domain